MRFRKIQSDRRVGRKQFGDPSRRDPGQVAGGRTRLAVLQGVAALQEAGLINIAPLADVPRLSMLDRKSVV